MEGHAQNEKLLDKKEKLSIKIDMFGRYVWC